MMMDDNHKVHAFKILLEKSSIIIREKCVNLLSKISHHNAPTGEKQGRGMKERFWAL